ncbi:MAG: FHA domain-containing protein [Patescibacteria group bacterium]|nr:FHA domain-containing protein [Patescibacteria group bacterium]
MKDKGEDMAPSNDQLISLEKSDIPYVLFTWPIVINREKVISQEVLIVGRAFYEQGNSKKEDEYEYRHLSRYHSEIVATLIKKKIHAYVFDLKSINGTYLNGVRLKEGMVRNLRDEDILVMGDIETKVFLGR